MSMIFPPALDWTDAVEVVFLICLLPLAEISVAYEEPLEFMTEPTVKPLDPLAVPVVDPPISFDLASAEVEGSHQIVDVYFTPFAEDVTVVRAPSEEDTDCDGNDELEPPIIEVYLLLRLGDALDEVRDSGPSEFRLSVVELRATSSDLPDALGRCWVEAVAAVSPHSSDEAAIL